MVRGHVVDGARAEDARAFEFPAIGQHLREAQVIASRGNQAVAARKKRLRFAEVDEFRRLAAIDVGHGLGEPVLLFGRHLKSGIDHFQRLEDAFGEKTVQRLSGSDFDDTAEHVSGVAVLPGGSRLELQRQLGERAAEIGKHPFLREDVGIFVHLLHRVQGAEHAVCQAGSVAQQVLHGDLPFRVDQREHRLAFAVGRFDADFHVFELGNVFRHRLLQAEPAFLDQHHRGDADDRLGHGIEAEDRIGAHRDFPVPVLPAETFRIHQLPVAGDQHDGAGQLAGLHRFLHGGVETAEPLRGHADFFRTGLRQWRGLRQYGGAGQHEKAKAMNQGLHGHPPGCWASA